MAELVKLSVVIVNWNTRERLESCLQGVQASSIADQEIIVVDNGSSDGSAEMVSAQFPDVRLIQNQNNEYFTKACNQGIQVARGENIFLVNSDIVLLDDAAASLLEVLESRPDVAAVAPMLVDQDSGVLPSCLRFPGLSTAAFYFTTLGRLFPGNKAMRSYYMRDWDHADSREVDQPPAACFLIRKSAIDDVGLMDENMLLYFSDVDWSKRIHEAGYSTLYVADVRAFHAVGASTRKLSAAVLLYHRDRVTYYRKYFGLRGVLICKIAMVDLALWEIIKTLRRVGFNRDFRHFSSELTIEVWHGLRKW
jgi:GT2 family glycosyltransferase